MDEHAVDIQKHVRAYLMVFAALMILTGVTVGVYYLHVPFALGVTIALLVATVKGALVACVFMHLISERKLIYAVLILTVVFFFVLLLLPVLTSVADRISA
jgi:cytochrome c oxidase subunit 4